MTEAQWLACAEPRPMLRFIEDRASDRKLRLFAVACCRRIWHLLPDRRCRTAVQIAEGNAGIRRLRKVEAAGEVYCDHREDVPEERLGYCVGGAIFQLGQERMISQLVADAASDAVAYSSPDDDAADATRRGESAAQCRLLRDIVGNPFHPISIDPRRLTSPVVDLARTMYDSRDFSAMPVLADALQDAGHERRCALALPG